MVYFSECLDQSELTVLGAKLKLFSNIKLEECWISNLFNGSYIIISKALIGLIQSTTALVEYPN